MKLIALLIAGSCAFAFAAKPDADQAEADVPSPKPKNVHQQPVTSKQEQDAPKNERSPGSKKEETTEPTPKKIRSNKKTKRAPADDDADDSTARATVTQAKKVPANIEKIRALHQKFQAKPSTTIATAQFNPDYRITAAQNWEGAPYEIFRSYQPQWHDQAWYQSRYNKNVLLIAGGWYVWEGGYWLPAWGYDESAAYYPYDGPIYVGQNPRPFDQVVADVQAVLHQQGYYRGEVDGLLGPLTQAALATYQTAKGLYPTQTIDEPTLQSFGLAD